MQPRKSVCLIRLKDSHPVKSEQTRIDVALQAQMYVPNSLPSGLYAKRIFEGSAFVSFGVSGSSDRSAFSMPLIPFQNCGVGHSSGFGLSRAMAVDAPGGNNQLAMVGWTVKSRRS